MKRKQLPQIADEPLPLQNERWVTRRKATLVDAVRNDRITLEEACRRYKLSPEEFAGWVVMLDRHGAPGLRATRFQIYRDVGPGSRTTAPRPIRQVPDGQSPAWEA